MRHHLLTGLAVILLFLRLRDWLQRLRSPTAPTKPTAPQASPKSPRPLHPRTPDDCPACRNAAPACRSTVAASVQPGPQRKRRRGRRKTIHTEGYACPNPECDYHHITDANVHALIGYGHHGKRERIPDLYCPACRRKFSVHHHTALYRLKTAAAQVAHVLTALAEGLSVSGTVHTFGHREHTITTWLRRAGTHAERLHGRLFRNLQLLEVQLDELRTTLRNKGQEVWIWIAYDVKTKVIAVVQLGPRNQVLAHTLIHTLVQVLVPGCVPLFTSDGLDLYFYALTAHFGQWIQVAGAKKRQWKVAAELLYGQVQKSYRCRKLAKVERRMRWGTWEAFQAKVQALGVSRTLNTAFVERGNLTIRPGIAALPRARGRKQRPQVYRKRTPAMAVGVTDHRWSVEEVLSFPLPA